MDEYSASQGMCAIAEFVNIDGSMSVEKLVRFFNGQEDMDKAFDWGFRWKAGSK
jgi:tellurite resistance protein TerA